MNKDKGSPCMGLSLGYFFQSNLICGSSKSNPWRSGWSNFVKLNKNGFSFYYLGNYLINVSIYLIEYNIKTSSKLNLK
jgi:hypothetical protein